MKNLPDFSISGVRTGQNLQVGGIVLGEAGCGQMRTRDESSAILSNTRTYPKREDSSGRLRKRRLLDAQPLKGRLLEELMASLKAMP
jgi:hypothetical protein